MNTIKSEATRIFEENILKTIKILIYEKGYAYIIDVARELEINQNTMYSAIKKLVDKGFIEALGPKGGKNERHSLKLTDLGENTAKNILDRHHLIEEWLVRLGLPVEEANLEACSLEHGLSDKSFILLKKHVDMASQYMGKNSQACKIIKSLEFKNEIETYEKDNIVNRMRNTIEKLGGFEGAKRKYRLSSRAGGDDVIEKLLDLVESAGGIEKTIHNLEIISKYNNEINLEELIELESLSDLGLNRQDSNLLKDLISSFGGIEKFIDYKQDLLDLSRILDKSTTLKDIKNSILILNKIGGMKRYRKIENISKPFGSIENMLNAVEKSLKPLIQALDK